MHAFVAAVLLWVAGLDGFDANAQAQPPYRELAQAEQGMSAGEGHAVVCADGFRQAELFERPLEDYVGVLSLVVASASQLSR